VTQPLADGRVRVYRLQGDAPAHDPAEPLAPEAVERKEKLLVAEADLDRPGGFTLEVEEPLVMELDVRVAAPGEKEARQFTLTRLDAAALRTGSLEHAISADVFKAIISPRRMIYGRITVCGTRQGMSGLKVSAFDDDCIQDDALGSDITDAGGNYVIYYSAAQYRKTPLSPLINVDTPLCAIPANTERPITWMPVHRASAARMPPGFHRSSSVPSGRSRARPRRGTSFTAAMYPQARSAPPSASAN
jgi:hypothetical protein